MSAFDKLPRTGLKDSSASLLPSLSQLMFFPKQILTVHGFAVCVSLVGAAELLIRGTLASSLPWFSCVTWVCLMFVSLLLVCAIYNMDGTAAFQATLTEIMVMKRRGSAECLVESLPWHRPQIWLARFVCAVMPVYWSVGILNFAVTLAGVKEDAEGVVVHPWTYVPDWLADTYMLVGANEFLLCLIPMIPALVMTVRVCHARIHAVLERIPTDWPPEEAVNWEDLSWSVSLLDEELEALWRVSSCDGPWILFSICIFIKLGLIAGFVIKNIAVVALYLEATVLVVILLAGLGSLAYLTNMCCNSYAASNSIVARASHLVGHADLSEHGKASHFRFWQFVQGRRLGVELGGFALIDYKLVTSVASNASKMIVQAPLAYSCLVAILGQHKRS